MHPFPRRDYRTCGALDDVSFEVRKGEFFGIVGRNGSGKSTLLKILASIYRADAGTIRMAGRLAPFIELGVGFNPELTARENVILNGVMMGLTPAQARERIDAVFEFAELEEFDDMRLKNYSSGMLVRLAFSVMIQVDADMLLIDEVLAVGDAAFQQKCADVFHGMNARGQDDRPRHPRHGRGRDLLRPGDADRRRRRPRGSATRPRSATQYLRLNFDRGRRRAERWRRGAGRRREEVRAARHLDRGAAGARGRRRSSRASELVVGAELEIAQRPAPGRASGSC